MKRTLNLGKAEAEFKFRLPDALKREFLDTCKRNKTVAADVLRSAIINYLSIVNSSKKGD